MGSMCLAFHSTSLGEAKGFNISNSCSKGQASCILCEIICGEVMETLPIAMSPLDPSTLAQIVAILICLSVTGA